MATASLDRAGESLTVAPQGILNLALANDLRGEIKDHVAQGARQVVFNLANTTGVDSSGIGLLIAVHNTLQKAGGKLKVTNASADVRRLLAAMRLDRHFEVDNPGAGQG